jgi:hypothetical protein
MTCETLHLAGVANRYVWGNGRGRENCGRDRGRGRGQRGCSWQACRCHRQLRRAGSHNAGEQGEYQEEKGAHSHKLRILLPALQNRCNAKLKCMRCILRQGRRTTTFEPGSDPLGGAKAGERDSLRAAISNATIGRVRDGKTHVFIYVGARTCLVGSSAISQNRKNGL